MSRLERSAPPVNPYVPDFYRDDGQYNKLNTQLFVLRKKQDAFESNVKRAVLCAVMIGTGILVYQNRNVIQTTLQSIDMQNIKKTANSGWDKVTQAFAGIKDYLFVK